VAVGLFCALKSRKNGPTDAGSPRDFKTVERAP